MERVAQGGGVQSGRPSWGRGSAGVAVGHGGTDSGQQEAVQCGAGNIQCYFCLFLKARSLFLILQGILGMAD